MARELQEASNFQLFSVRLTDRTAGGTAVPAPSSAAFYLYDAITGAAILSAGLCSVTLDGEDYVIGYRVGATNLTDVQRVRWQFKITWTSPARVQWTPIEEAAVRPNLARVEPAPYLLDTLSTQPAWAPCVHTQMKSGQTFAIRVRRSSDDAEADIGFIDGVTNLAELSAHCGAGDGFLVRAYNPGSKGGYLDQDTASKQPKIYASGSPVLDARGQLTITFADTQLLETDYDYSGDVAITMVYDAAPVGGVGQLTLYLYPEPDADHSYEVDTNFGSGGWAEFQWIAADLNRFYSYFDETVGWDLAPGWFQFGRTPGQTLAQTVMRGNGVVYDQALPDSTVPNDLHCTAIDWGFGNSTALGSTFLIFESAPLSADDQTKVDAWFSAHYTSEAP